jgi:hypothetical protein
MKWVEYQEPLLFPKLYNDVDKNIAKSNLKN